MKNETVFKLSWDKLTKGMTIFFVGLMVGLGIMFVGIGVSQLKEEMVVGIIMSSTGTLMLLFVPAVAFFAPVNYLVGPSAITVWRYGPKIRIPIEDITEVQAVELKNVIRVCAVGGAFGSWGRFYYKSLGSFRAYVSRNDNLAIIRVKKGAPFVLSPDDREGFIAAVRRALANRK